VELLVKERLTGAIILVVLIVLLVPELLSGPKGPSAPVSAGAAATSSEEPPLRSYTINLGDDSHARSASAESSGPAMPQPSGPEQSTVQAGASTPDAAQKQSEEAGAPQAADSSAQAPQQPGSAITTPPYQTILENLRTLLDYVKEMSTDLDRGRVLLLLKEKSFRDPIEALALSDGTLRLLAILTALETMPDHGLLCLEEPEHGLHPLLFGPLLDLVRERCPVGSSRQVLLTTHSPDLVDAAEPEEVVPVERDETGSTVLIPLDREHLGKWLKNYRLGELWRMRQIGGVQR